MASSKRTSAVIAPRKAVDESVAKHSPPYGEVLRLDELLTWQTPFSSNLHDEVFFIAVHQIHELWFRVVLHELEAAREHIDDDAIPRALYSLRRVHAIERVLVEQVDTLETISPGSFRHMRSVLGASSGFQSAQFREIEFLSGLKDPSYLDAVEVTATERRRLERRLDEPTLWDAFMALLDRRGMPDLLTLLRQDAVYNEVHALAEALLDHDEGFCLWRSRHVRMVERMIGYKHGTGGSSGVSYLQATTEKRFYPPLWELRTEL